MPGMPLISQTEPSGLELQARTIVNVGKHRLGGSARTVGEHSIRLAIPEVLHRPRVQGHEAGRRYEYIRVGNAAC